MLRLAPVLALVTGCGRFGFDLFDDKPELDARSPDTTPPVDGPTFEQIIGDSHLVGYWKLDDGFFLDSSQYQNPANSCYTSCPTLGPGLRGMAADFHDNEGLQVGTVAPLSSLSTSLTIAAWVNLRTLTDYGAVVSNDRDCSNCQVLDGFSLWSSLYAGEPRFLVWNQSMTSFGPAAPQLLPTNTWTFLAATYDGQAVKLYVDAALSDSLDQPNAIGTPHSYPLRIGHQGFDYAGGVDGLIDEVMIFDRPLSASELQTIYVTLKP